MSDVMKFCQSRNASRRCTRALGHPGLHKHRMIMWVDAAADPPRCAGSAASAVPAPTMADGYPHGRGLCVLCHRFVEITGTVLADHDTFDPAESAAEYECRREWFNTNNS